MPYCVYVYIIYKSFCRHTKKRNKNWELRECGGVLGNSYVNPRGHSEEMLTFIFLAIPINLL